MQRKPTIILLACFAACCSCIEQQKSHGNIFSRRKPSEPSHEVIPKLENVELKGEDANAGIYDNLVVAQRRNLKGMSRVASLEQSATAIRKKMAQDGLTKRVEPKNNVRVQIQPDPVENAPCDDDLEQLMLNLAMSMSMPRADVFIPQPSNMPETKQPTLLPTKSPTISLPKVSTVPPTISPVTEQSNLSGTKQPTLFPTNAPTISLPKVSTVLPISSPLTKPPSLAPVSPEPSALAPTKKRSEMPSAAPTAAPDSKLPTLSPTGKPFVRTSAPTQATVCNPPLSTDQRQSELLAMAAEISPEDLILTAGSSQNKAFSWLIGEDTALVCPENKLDVVQRYIMAVNYFSLGGDSWRVCNRSNATIKTCVNGEPHLSSADVCDWFNVSCTSDTNSITSVILDNNNLKGTLPSEFGSFTVLERIGFNNNPDISGSIPTSYGSIATLKVLDLNSSALTGVLPSSLCSASQLERLDTLANRLVGTIPSCIGMLGSLNTLALDKNLLTGELPSHIGAMTSLEYLTVNDNALNGTLPTELGNNSAFKVISLQQNMLTGTIPASLGSLTAMETLNFFSNQLIGPVPPELGNLSQMENLFLHFNSLTGTMPEGICALRADRGVGRIQQLTADCGTRGSIVCPRECCTACF